MAKRTDEAGANATNTTKESLQQGALSPEEQRMMQDLEREAQMTGNAQSAQKEADDTVPTQTKNSAAPPPLTPEREEEIKKTGERLGFLEQTALNDPAQRLSPLHDNEVVVATIPSLSTKDIDRGPIAKFGGPFAFAARGSKKKVAEALKNIGDAPAQNPMSQLGKALGDVAQDMVGNLEVADNQGLSVRIAVSGTMTNFTATAEVKQYDAQLPVGMTKLEDLERLEDEQRNAKPAEPADVQRQRQLEEDARIGRAVRAANQSATPAPR